MIRFKKQILIFMLPFFLASCAKSFFFGEKGGADAYRVGALDPLKMPSTLGQDLPKPEAEKTYASLPSKAMKASEILGIQNTDLSDHTISDAILKNNANKETIDFKTFDAEMQAQYQKEKASRENTVIDTLLGRDNTPLDPVINEEEDDSIFSF